MNENETAAGGGSGSKKLLFFIAKVSTNQKLWMQLSTLNELRTHNGEDKRA